MSTISSGALHHHAQRMGGRDPHEEHRTAHPLELLFDLTFVIAFGLAASQFAHALAEAHYFAALIGFGFASFAICWAWINFSWFASAYDTDDWIFRIVTMVQMTGVLVLAIGLPRMFASIEHGAAARQFHHGAGLCDHARRHGVPVAAGGAAGSARRRACLTYVVAIAVAHGRLGDPDRLRFHRRRDLRHRRAAVAGRDDGARSSPSARTAAPWHPHHIAERYSLFAIIALGEGVVGTVATLSAVVEEHGWTLDAALVCMAGTGLTFGMWWIFYMLPSGPVLHGYRDRSFVWGYGLIVPIAAIVATGAGPACRRLLSSRTRPISARWRRCSPSPFRSASFCCRSTVSITIWCGGSIPSMSGCCCATAAVSGRRRHGGRVRRQHGGLPGSS